MWLLPALLWFVPASLCRAFFLGAKGTLTSIDALLPIGRIVFIYVFL